MKWLTNHYMPKDASHKIYPHERGVSIREQILWEREWLKDKIIGRPKATDAYTVEQLEEMEYVGVYENPTLTGKDAKDYIRALLEQQ